MLSFMDIHLPAIPGISARPLTLAGDYQVVADLVVAEAVANGQDDAVTTAEDV